MDTFTAMNERMITMEFKDYSLPKVIIENILDMATKAPSARNRRPWKFAIIRAKKLEEFVEFIIDNNINLDVKVKNMEKAAAIILIFNKYKRLEENYKDFIEEMDLISIGSALQNLVLSVESFNLGSIVLGSFAKYEKEIGEYLGINEAVVTGVAIGFAGDNCIKRDNEDFENITVWLE